MSGVLDALGAERPVLVAPMAGGPTTPAFVVAAARAGSLGFLAAGYKSADALAEQIAAVRSETGTFGVNLFVPNPMPVDPGEFRRYAELISRDADAFGVDLSDATPLEDDDAWGAKLEVLASDPVPVVSFTFGIPEAAVIERFRRMGTLTVQTVTSVEEARLAADAGVDALAVQSGEAGGHSGTLTPLAPVPAVRLSDLVPAVRAAVDLPILAAGGLATGPAIARTLAAGAEAAIVGTVLLRCDESASSNVHRAALADHSRGEPVLTHAFTGRPARGLSNRFIERYEAVAPLGYPAINHLTSPLRRASVAAGDPEFVNVWAGTGYRHATAEPLASILTRLCERL